MTSEQVAQWDFGNFFVPFGLPKIIFVDTDELFNDIFKMAYEDKLLIPVYAVTRGNHKTNIN